MAAPTTVLIRLFIEALQDANNGDGMAREDAAKEMGASREACRSMDGGIACPQGQVREEGIPAPTQEARRFLRVDIALCHRVRYTSR